jgi:hypothetical protein
MIKMILVYLIATGALALLIQEVRQMTNRERWSLTKLLIFSIMCSLLAALVIMGIVVIF